MDKPSPHNKINPFDTGDLRNYFRVKSAVNIRTAAVTALDIKEKRWPNNLGKSPSMQLLESLRSIEQESSSTLRSIAEKNRPSEQYLRSINKRIELIASFLTQSDSESAQNRGQKVLISEGGIEFAVHDLSETKIGDTLAMEITLKLSHMALSVYGKVINIRESSNKYLIGVEFLEVSDQDRQQLAKHVMQQQMQDKRDAKN